MRCTTSDRVTLSQREKTREGYLHAPATIGRCGIQVYGRGELGLDGDPKAPVRLMRLADEVFRPETIASFENKPITYRHPTDGVDAKNWPELSKGHLRDVAKQTGDLLGGTTWVMDADQVARVDSGDAELSCGYSFELDLTPGTAPDGQAFDGYQRKILGDHLAILDAQMDSPRGGERCRIADDKENDIMKRIVKTSDGLVVGDFEEPQATAVEAVVQRLEKDRDLAVADVAKLAESAKARDAAAKALILDGKQIGPAEAMSRIAADALKIADLQKKILTDQQIDALIEKRTAEAAALRSAADSLGLKTLDLAGKTPAQARKAMLAAAVAADAQIQAVVKAVLGDGAIEAANDAVVETLVKTLASQARSGSAGTNVQDAAVVRALTGTDGNTRPINGGTVANDGKIIEVDFEHNEQVLLGELG